MKYIRTKDGIYEETLVSICELDGIKYASDDEMCYAEIIKQADILEELFDEFVDIYENEKPEIALLSDIMFFESYKTHIIYGAIWTDKGLIFVARMNNEGVLELL